MKNIQEIKKKKQLEFAKKYYKKDYNELSQAESYHISSIAEVWSYIESVIPESFEKFTIFDFKGSCKDIKLKREIALKAKDVICQYCWGETWGKIDQKFSTKLQKKEFLRDGSVMMERLRGGNNVVVFGKSTVPIGRTICASIIMKQAIKLRMLPGQIGQTYDWIDFSILKESLRKDTDSSVDCRTCDWLVVDNITTTSFASNAQRAFITDLITPFFIGRLNNKLSTILVFRFDIRNKSINLEEDMGVGISKIINSDRTFIIPLN